MACPFCEAVALLVGGLSVLWSSRPVSWCLVCSVKQSPAVSWWPVCSVKQSPAVSWWPVCSVKQWPCQPISGPSCETLWSCLTWGDSYSPGLWYRCPGFFLLSVLFETELFQTCQRYHNDNFWMGSFNNRTQKEEQRKLTMQLVLCSVCANCFSYTIRILYDPICDFEAEIIASLIGIASRITCKIDIHRKWDIAISQWYIG